MAKQSRVSNSEIMAYYAKYLLLPGFLIKGLLVLAFFKWPIFYFACSLGDYLGEVYYVLLYTIFLIPFFDLPLLLFVMHRKDKTWLSKHIVASLAWAISDTFLIFLSTISLAFSVAMTIKLLNLPFCSIAT